MRQTILLFIASLFIVACSKPAAEETDLAHPAPYTLSVDKTVIESDGHQVATFSITDANGEVLTSNPSLMSKIYFKNENTGKRLARRTNTFRSVEDGEYTFSATYSGKACANTVTVKSENRTSYEVFRKNVCLYRLTATWCQNCPTMTDGLNNVNDWTKGRIIEMAIHAAKSTFAIYDGKNYIADYLYPRFGLTGYPSCIYDLEVGSESRSYTEIEDIIFNRLADAPATCGIKASNTYSPGQISLTASVKTSTGGKYDLGYAIVQNGCDGGADAYEEVYDNVVVAISGNYEFLSDSAVDLAKDEERQIVNHQGQSYTLPDSGNLSDYSVVFFALKKVGDDVNIDNVVKMPLNSSVDYVYNSTPSNE